MRLVKGFLVVIIGFFVLVTLISLLFPSRVVTVKSTTIHAPEPKIMAQLAHLQQWKQWHPLFKTQASSLRISTPDSGKGATASWQINEKKYTIAFEEVLPNAIRFNVEASGEKPIETMLAILPMQEPGTFQVEWRALTHLKWYPWEKFAGIFVSEMTGPGYQQALDSLQKFMERP